MQKKKLIWLYYLLFVFPFRFSFRTPFDRPVDRAPPGPTARRSAAPARPRRPGSAPPRPAPPGGGFRRRSVEGRWVGGGWGWPFFWGRCFFWVWGLFFFGLGGLGGKKERKGFERDKRGFFKIFFLFFWGGFGLKLFWGEKRRVLRGSWLVVAEACLKVRSFQFSFPRFFLYLQNLPAPSKGCFLKAFKY